MNRYIVIADDLTGANATNSLIRKTGLRAASLLSLEGGQIPHHIDALAYTTNSRAISEEKAYQRVKAAVVLMKSKAVEIYNKRIDSTLRGNLGAEVQAFLDALGEDRMAIAVPCYPATGRIVVNRKMLVNGLLLELSDAGKDTIAPVHSSDVIELFQKQFKGLIRHIALDEIQKGSERIEELLRKAKEEGVKLVVFDGVTDADVNRIAEATLESNIPFIAVDPGPFTLSLIRMKLDEAKTMSKVLMAVGSVTDLTIEQLNTVINDLNPEIIEVDAAALINPSQRVEEIERAIQIADKMDPSSEIILITTTPKSMDLRLDLAEEGERLGLQKEDVSEAISHGLSHIAKEVLKNDKEFSGVFVSGGDIMVSLCLEAKAAGIEIISEIVPLAAYGTMIGGELDGMRLISKGGMVGDKNTMKFCVNTLRGVNS